MAGHQFARWRPEGSRWYAVQVWAEARDGFQYFTVLYLNDEGQAQTLVDSLNSAYDATYKAAHA